MSVFLRLITIIHVTDPGSVSIPTVCGLFTLVCNIFIVLVSNSGGVLKI